jgi:hypothetical protein
MMVAAFVMLALEVSGPTSERLDVAERQAVQGSILDTFCAFRMSSALRV